MESFVDNLCITHVKDINNRFNFVNEIENYRNKLIAKRSQPVKGPKYLWQDRASYWVNELKISPKDSAIIFKYFKKYQENLDYVIRACNLVYEIQPKKPLAYFLKILRK